MEQKELTIETLAVEIKVVRIGGHKMTKAVFDQLPVLQIDQVIPSLKKTIQDDLLFIQEDPLDFATERIDGACLIEFYKVDNPVIYGYIWSSGYWLLTVKNGRLFKIPNTYIWADNEGKHEITISGFVTFCERLFSQLFIAT